MGFETSPFYFVFSPTCDSEPRFSNSPALSTMPQVNLIERVDFNKMMSVSYFIPAIYAVFDSLLYQ